MDNIVHFSEALPWGALTMANAKFVGADFTLVLGSSLRVEPAAGLPFKAKRRARRVEGEPPRVRCVIVNLQPTPRDAEADLVIHARCEEVLNAIARALVPGWAGGGGAASSFSSSAAADGGSASSSAAGEGASYAAAGVSAPTAPQHKKRR